MSEARRDLKLALEEYSMTPQELMDFINEAPRYCTVSTMRKDGSPMIDGLGFEWDGEYAYFSLRDTRAMNKRLQRDPRICLHMMNSAYPVKWVRIEGHVEIIEDPHYERTLRIMHKYMDKDSDAQELSDFDVDAYDANYVAFGRTMYRIVPKKIHTHDANKQAAVFELTTGDLLEGADGAAAQGS